MKAITIWQPWATLIMVGAKPYEFRGWQLPRQRQFEETVIHAGARPVKRTEVEGLLAQLHSDDAWMTCLIKHLAIPVLERALSRSSMPLPLSAGLGTAIIGAPIDGFTAAERMGGSVNDSDRAGHSNWAWPLSGITAFAEPIACKGAQGFWNWPCAAAAAEAFA